MSYPFYREVLDNQRNEAVIAVGTVTAGSDEINYRNFGYGMIIVPSTWSAATLTFHVAEKLGGTYLPAQDSTGAAVTLVAASSKAFPMPVSLIGAPAIKITCATAGSCYVTLKS